MYEMGGPPLTTFAALPQQQRPIAIIAPTNTPRLPGPTPWIRPTITPVLEFALPTPMPGTGQAIGRALCNGAPKQGHWITLVVITETALRISRMILTDENGRWFVNNLHPGIYAVLGEYPRSPPDDQALNQRRAVKAGQMTDFGDLELPPWLCR